MLPSQSLMLMEHHASCEDIIPQQQTKTKY